MAARSSPVAAPLLGRQSAYCWGDNFHGQLGIGFTQSDPPFPVPQQVLNLP